MDFRSGLILVCMLFARASCQPVRRTPNEKASIETIKAYLESLLGNLSASPLPPNKTCNCLIESELLVLEKQQSLSDQVSTFRCYMHKFSDLIKVLSNDFKSIMQVMHDMEHRMTGKVVHKNCSLPTLEEDQDKSLCAKCILEQVQETLTKL